VSSDAVTLDVSTASDAAVVDADPGLEDLILGGAAADEDVVAAAANPILLQLDQEQIKNLENALRSEEAKGIMDGEGQNGDEDLEDNEDNQLDTSLADILAAGEAEGEALHEDMEDASAKESALAPLESVTSSAAASPGPASPAAKVVSQGPPKRRSQRQQDKEIREEAEKIRLENLELMRKEREDASKKENAKEDVVETTGTVKGKISAAHSAARPKRERRLPAHLKSGDFATSLTDGGKKKNAPASVITTEQTPEQIKDLPKKPADQRSANGDNEDDEDEEEDDDGDFSSEDDPDRLWCICKQPHNNRFMICCDTCLDWFHGKCVGVTKSMGKEMEEAGKDWRCPKCKESEAQAKTEAKTKELKQKLAEREEEKKRKLEAAAAKKATAGKKEEKVSHLTSVLVHINIVVMLQRKATCHLCEKAPEENSLYCSEECLRKHVAKAKLAYSRDKKTVRSPILPGRDLQVRFLDRWLRQPRNADGFEGQLHVERPFSTLLGRLREVALEASHLPRRHALIRPFYLQVLRIQVEEKGGSQKARQALQDSLS